jgi:hypothetical protein
MGRSHPMIGPLLVLVANVVVVLSSGTVTLSFERRSVSAARLRSGADP